MPEPGPAETPGVKSIYLAPRHPSLSRADFVPRWRAHGELAMELDFWRFAGRYTHGDVLVLPAASGAGLELARDDYFGVGMVWFPGGETALRSLVEDPDFPRLYADELEAFGGYVDDVTLLTRETVLRRSQEPVGARLVAFLRRARGEGHEELWRACRERLACDDESLLRYTENRSILSGPREGGEEGSDRLPHHTEPPALADRDGVVELGFAGADELLAYCAEHELLRGGDLPGDGEPLVLAVNEVVLDPGGE